MALPIHPTPSLSKKEWEEFIKMVEEGLKHPTGLIPTPKLGEAIKLVQKMAKARNMGWKQIEKGETLEDGWYWQKAGSKSLEPECIEVINGVWVGSEPIDSHGAEWRVTEEEDFSGWWWYGPIEAPHADQGKVKSVPLSVIKRLTMKEEEIIG